MPPVDEPLAGDRPEVLEDLAVLGEDLLDLQPHTVVAAADGRDARRRMRAGEARLEVRQEWTRGARWRVPTVQDRVDHDVFDTLASGQLRDRHEVPVVGVHAAGADEAHEVQSTIPSDGGPGRLHERFVGEERAVGDGSVDTRQVLEHGPTGTDVQVPDLAVAHLAVGQPDGRARGVQHGVRPGRQHLPPARHARRRDGIHGRIGPDAKAVDDEQHDRARPTRAARRHAPAAARRAAAVVAARATMPAISSTLRLAPPTSAPSMAGSARNSPMEPLVTLPP